MGRPPKTAAEHRKAGTYQPCRHAGRADSLGSGVAPDKPPGLDDDASWLWDTIVAGPIKIALDPTDAPMLWGLCRWWSIWRHTDRQLDAGEAGYHGMARAAAAWRLFERVASKFGLSPSCRAALKIPANEPLSAGKERHFRLLG